MELRRRAQYAERSGVTPVYALLRTNIGGGASSSRWCFDVLRLSMQQGNLALDTRLSSLRQSQPNLPRRRLHDAFSCNRAHTFWFSLALMSRDRQSLGPVNGVEEISADVRGVEMVRFGSGRGPSEVRIRTSEGSSIASHLFLSRAGRCPCGIHRALIQSLPMIMCSST